MSSKTAWIQLNGNDYVITYYEDKFGACSGIGKGTQFMKVKPCFENTYKLLKTLIHCRRGAEGAYNWVLLCSHYQSNMDYAEKLVKHVLENGKGIR